MNESGQHAPDSEHVELPQTSATGPDLAPENEVEDPRLCELLDAYVDAVQRRRPDLVPALPADLVALHPELGSWLGCLQKLDALVPAVTLDAETPRGAAISPCGDETVSRPLSKPAKAERGSS